MADLSIYETLDGGDVAIQGNDLQLVESLFNQPYLGLFGGNIAQSTPVDAEEIQTLERFDYWGNQLLYRDNPELQNNSAFERTMDLVALTSAGLQELTQVGKDDLSFLEEVGRVDFSVSLVGVDKIEVDVLLVEPETLQERNFVFLWNGTRLEQIIPVVDIVTPESQPPIVENPIIDGSGDFIVDGSGNFIVHND